MDHRLRDGDTDGDGVCCYNNSSSSSSSNCTAGTSRHASVRRRLEGRKGVPSLAGRAHRDGKARWARACTARCVEAAFPLPRFQTGTMALLGPSHDGMMPDGSVSVSDNDIHQCSTSAAAAAMAGACASHRVRIALPSACCARGVPLWVTPAWNAFPIKRQDLPCWEERQRRRPGSSLDHGTCGRG